MKHAFRAAAFAAALVATAAVAGAQSFSLDGVTIGQPLASLRPQFGDPLEVYPHPDGNTIWRYLQAQGNLVLDVIWDKTYAVRGISVHARRPTSVFTDPFGVALNSTHAQVRAVRGAPDDTQKNSSGSLDFSYNQGKAAWIYAFDRNRLIYVQIAGDDVPVSPGTPVTAPGATSTGDAALMVQPDASAGLEAENAYIAARPCAGGTWSAAQRATLKSGGVTYDVVMVACSRGKETRKFYFEPSWLK